LPGCARHPRHDGSLSANQAIEQRGFTDVRPANDGNFDGPEFPSCRSRWGIFRRNATAIGHLRDGGVEEVVYAGAVLGGDWEDGSPKAMKISGIGFLQRRINFVHRYKK